MKNKKNKLFPYGVEHREVIGYSMDKDKTPLYRVTRIMPKEKSRYRWLFRVSIVLLLICGVMFLAGCSTTPIVDNEHIIIVEH